MVDFSHLGSFCWTSFVSLVSFAWDSNLLWGRALEGLILTLSVPFPQGYSTWIAYSSGQGELSVVSFFGIEQKVICGLTRERFLQK